MFIERRTVLFEDDGRQGEGVRLGLEDGKNRYGYGGGSGHECVRGRCERGGQTVFSGVALYDFAFGTFPDALSVGVPVGEMREGCTKPGVPVHRPGLDSGSWSTRRTWARSMSVSPWREDDSL